MIGRLLLAGAAGAVLALAAVAAWAVAAANGAAEYERAVS